MRKDEHQKTFGKNYEQPVQQNAHKRTTVFFLVFLVLPATVQTQGEIKHFVIPEQCIHFYFKQYKNGKNRPRKARVYRRIKWHIFQRQCKQCQWERHCSVVCSLLERLSGICIGDPALLTKIHVRVHLRVCMGWATYM